MENGIGLETRYRDIRHPKKESAGLKPIICFFS
jgi:hypothetical protein